MNKRRSVGKSKASLDVEMLLYATGGALASLASNYLVGQVIKNQGQNVKDTVDKFLPIAKAAGGYFLTTMSKDARLAYAGIGVMAESATEFALKAGSQYFVPSAVSGFGDVFTSIGDPYRYDSLPGASMGSMHEDIYSEGDELIAGAGGASDLIV